jgi:hypothetical protein
MGTATAAAIEEAESIRSFHRLITIIVICLFLVAGLALIIWAVDYYVTIHVDYTFEVPQRFNATYCTLDTPWSSRNIWNQTPLPYTFHDWAWEGHTISLTVHYFVLVQPEQPVQDFNGTNITVAPSPPQYQLVGSETFLILVTRHSGGLTK